jgi:hypothetical protein
VAYSPPRQRASGSEVEPNDDHDSANQLEAGDSIAGIVGPRTDDWYVVPVDAGQRNLFVKVRALEGSHCHIYFYSADETVLRPHQDLPAPQTVQQWEVPLEGVTAVFLRVHNLHGGSCRYELFTGHTRL